MILDSTPKLPFQTLTKFESQYYILSPSLAYPQVFIILSHSLLFVHNVVAELFLFMKNNSFIFMALYFFLLRLAIILNTTLSLSKAKVGEWRIVMYSIEQFYYELQLTIQQ